VRAATRVTITSAERYLGTCFSMALYPLVIGHARS
jgi:hypothetical protein